MGWHMNYRSLALISVFLLSGCFTTKTNWESTAGGLFKNACDYTSDDVKKVRSWYVTHGEDSIADAKLVHSRISGNNGIIEIINKAHSEGKIEATSEYGLKEELRELEKSYGKYTRSLDQIFDVQIPATGCNTENAEEKCYDTYKSAVITKVSALETRFSDQGEEAFLDKIVIIGKALYPFVKPVFSQGCKMQLRNHMSGKRTELSSVGNVSILGELDF